MAKVGSTDTAKAFSCIPLSIYCPLCGVLNSVHYRLTHYAGVSFPSFARTKYDRWLYNKLLAGLIFKPIGWWFHTFCWPMPSPGRRQPAAVSFHHGVAVLRRYAVWQQMFQNSRSMITLEPTRFEVFLKLNLGRRTLLLKPRPVINARFGIWRYSCFMVSCQYFALFDLIFKSLKVSLLSQAKTHLFSI